MDSKGLEAALGGALPESDCGRMLTESAKAADAAEFRERVEKRLPKLKGSPLIAVAARTLYGEPKPKKKARASDDKPSE